MFDFLGFMHYNLKIRIGKYVIGHKMNWKQGKLKYQVIIKQIKEYLVINLMETIKELNNKLIGLYTQY